MATNPERHPNRLIQETSTPDLFEISTKTILSDRLSNFGFQESYHMFSESGRPETVGEGGRSEKDKE